MSDVFTDPLDVFQTVGSILGTNYKLAIQAVYTGLRAIYTLPGASYNISGTWTDSGNFSGTFKKRGCRTTGSNTNSTRSTVPYES